MYISIIKIVNSDLYNLLSIKALVLLVFKALNSLFNHHRRKCSRDRETISNLVSSENSCNRKTLTLTEA